MSTRSDIYALNGGPETSEARPGAGMLTPEGVAAARRLAEAHREMASQLPVSSPIRALALRCGAHWARLGSLPAGSGLKRVPPAA